MFETPMTHANHIEIIEDNMANFGGPAHPSSIHLNKVAVICGKISTVPKGNNFLNHSSNHLPIYPSFTHHFPIISPSIKSIPCPFPNLSRPTTRAMSPSQLLVRIHRTELRLRDAKEVAVEVLDACDRWCRWGVVGERTIETR
jgi:hypothetical protein